MMGRVSNKRWKDRTDSSNCESIKPTEVEDRQDCNYKQRGFQDRFRSDNNRSNTYRGRPKYGQDY